MAGGEMLRNARSHPTLLMWVWPKKLLAMGRRLELKERVSRESGHFSVPCVWALSLWHCSSAVTSFWGSISQKALAPAGSGDASSPLATPAPGVEPTVTRSWVTYCPNFASPTLQGKVSSSAPLGDFCYLLGT